MPSFDIVSKINAQDLSNAINNAKKEILNRYDFNSSKSSVEHDAKTNILLIVTENEMRLKAIEDVLIARLLKQNIDPKCMDFGKQEYASGNMIRKEIKIKEGIDREAAKKINKLIKDSGTKAQSSIMDDQIRVTSKKIDELQSVISLIRSADLDVAVQFINMR